jgi:hypothetical protein
MTADHTGRDRRGRRAVENREFDAFARRIVRAYARRVAAGDIEALGALRRLSSLVEDATKDAVAGLREFGYTWAEIADRLGTSPQTAQMRWGRHPDECGRLDTRLLNGGLAVTVSTLVTVFMDHHPGNPRAALCPSCGFRYPDGVLDCPTNAVVRPLLRRRRHEDPAAFARLTADQQVELVTGPERVVRAAAERTVSARSVDSGQPLFDLSQKGVR